MRTYLDIVKTCKLTKFVVIEDIRKVEEWCDGEFIFTCTWLSQNETYLPTTIEWKCLED